MTEPHTHPFGDEITSTSNDREKFATYTRDAYTGLDYANQRYFASTYGRFNTPDMTGKGMGLSEPESFNRYSYVLGDPVNKNDPRGTCAIDVTNGTVTYGTNGYDDCLFDSDPDGNLPEIDQDTMIQAQMANALSAIASEFASAQPIAAPTCSISLYERPVDIPGTSTPTGKYHTFIDESTTFANGVSVSEILDGGPTLTLSGLKLTGWDTLGTVGHYSTDNINLPASMQIGDPQSGAYVCGDITKMDAEVSAYNNGKKVLYNPSPTFLSPGWNSNSFSYTLLNSVGLAFSFGTTPPSAPGWGLQVPGLTQP